MYVLNKCFLNEGMIATSGYWNLEATQFFLAYISFRLFLKFSVSLSLYTTFGIEIFNPEWVDWVT